MVAMLLSIRTCPVGRAPFGRRLQASAERCIVALACTALLGLLACTGSRATPANRMAAERYFDRFLAKKLDNCSLCHRPLQAGRAPDSLADFPHNPFGARLRQVGESLRSAGRKADI